MRRRKLIALAGLAVLVAVGAFVLWPRPDRITEENYQRIQEGMSRAEVEAILGPPGDHRTGATYTYPQIGTGVFSAKDLFFVFATGPAWPVWKGDAVEIQIQLNDSGHATHKGRLTAHRIEQTPLDNLLWRAKRQWRKWFPD
jgi:hypothetical protein